MPHGIIKLCAGRSEQQKAKIAEEVTKAVMVAADCAERVRRLRSAGPSGRGIVSLGVV